MGTIFLWVTSSVTGTVARWISPLLAFVTVVGLVLSDGTQPSPAVRLTSDDNPLAGAPFYVDPISAAMSAAKNANPPNPVLTSIANTPQAYWLDQAFPAPAVTNTVSRYVGAAKAAGSMPVLVIYAIPHRDCGSFAAGRVPTGAAPSPWIAPGASRLGSMAAAFIFVPPALDMATTLSAGHRP